MSYIDLCTVAQVNSWLGQAVGADSAVIASAITNFSRYVLTRTARPYLGGFSTYSERYNGNGSHEIQLRNYPVLSVQSLQIGTQSIPQSPDFVQFGYVVDPSGSQAAVAIVGGGWIGDRAIGERGNWGAYGNAPALGQSPWRFCEGISNIAVSYTAGFVTTAYSEPQTIPSVSPYTVKVTNAATFYDDLGVTSNTGTAISGYTVSSGTYTFPSALAGTQVLVTYQYGAVPEDLNQMTLSIVSTNYRRRKWIDEVSQNQPGIGTTSYLQKEMAPQDAAVIERYTRRFQI